MIRASKTVERFRGNTGTEGVLQAITQGVVDYGGAALIISTIYCEDKSERIAMRAIFYK